MEFFNDYGRQALKVVHEGKKKSMLIVRNHLQPAGLDNWSELHHEKFSKIQVELYDYTNENNKIRVKFNLDPDQCMDMYDVMMMKYNTFNMDTPYYKEYKGKCSYFTYSRNPSMNSPWIINIENGECDQNHKTNHDANPKLLFYMSETEFTHFVRAMKTIIDVFSYTFGSYLFLKGYNKSREAEKQNREQYNQQNANNSYQQINGNPQQQTYNAPADNSTYNYPPQNAPSQQTRQQPVSTNSYSNPPGWN